LNRRWYERNAGHQVVGVQNRIFHPMDGGDPGRPRQGNGCRL
jgi:hypothetical protein